MRSRPRVAPARHHTSPSWPVLVAQPTACLCVPSACLLPPQERPEDVPTGDLPRSMMCLVDRRLVGSVSPGTRVTAVGILSIFQGKDGEPCAWRDGQRGSSTG